MGIRYRGEIGWKNPTLPYGSIYVLEVYVSMWFNVHIGT